MVFKNFRIQVVARVLVLAIALALLVWCLVHGYYLRGAYVGFAVAVLVVEFVRYVDRINHEVKTFLLSLSQHDFTSVFPDTGRGKSHYELHQALNHITGLFQTISSEKEIQHRYLEMLVDHVRVGILSFTDDGTVHLANEAVKKMLGRKVLGNIQSLETLEPELLATLREIRTGETRLVNVTVDQNMLNLSVHAAEFRLDTTYYKLISLQNIRSELDARELDSWQKLIRVLTHEIMNSIAPISSLSDTLHKLVRQHQKELNVEVYEPLEKGLAAISMRSEGLHGFTEAYRKLTRVPQPNFRLVDLRDVVNRVVALIKPDIDKHGIKIILTGSSQIISIDPELMEHVLLNIMQNAVEALQNVVTPVIRISIQRTSDAVLLEISDNGLGISPEIVDKIFIPFFTTKPGGSGIGLALSRQIMQLHRGYLHASTAPGSGAFFTLSFPREVRVPRRTR